VKNTFLKLWNLVLLISVALLISCEGPVGPMGPEGPIGAAGQDGLDGDSFLGTVFEIQGDFTSENDFSLWFEFPESTVVYESDVVLVYILWEQTTTTGDEVLDVWRLLPQTVFLDEGVLQYNYDFTYVDVLIFLEGTIDLNTLLPAEAEDQIFRIVILPADYAESKSLDVSDYNTLMKSLNLNPDAVNKIDLRDRN
jgi:hypothetical protein